MNSKKTLILGASSNPDRYSYKVYQLLKLKGHETVLLGNKREKLEHHEIKDNWPDLDLSGIDTVTLYLNPKNQYHYYEHILQLKPARVIFNPGTENEAFYKLLEEKNISFEEACTLVLLNINLY